MPKQSDHIVARLGPFASTTRVTVQAHTTPPEMPEKQEFTVQRGERLIIHATKE